MACHIFLEFSSYKGKKYILSAGTLQNLAVDQMHWPLQVSERICRSSVESGKQERPVQRRGGVRAAGVEWAVPVRSGAQHGLGRRAVLGVEGRMFALASDPEQMCGAGGGWDGMSAVALQRCALEGRQEAGACHSGNGCPAGSLGGEPAERRVQFQSALL